MKSLQLYLCGSFHITDESPRQARRLIHPAVSLHISGIVAVRTFCPLPDNAGASACGRCARVLGHIEEFVPRTPVLFHIHRALHNDPSVCPALPDINIAGVPVHTNTSPGTSLSTIRPDTVR